MEIQVFVENVLQCIHFVYRFLNGHFKNCRLRQPYRQIWMFVTWSCVVFLYFVILFNFYRFWGLIMNKLNFLIWG